MAWSEAQKRYAKSSKGLEARSKYQMSERGKTTKAAYMARRRAKLQEAKQQKTEINYAPVKEKPTEVKKEVKNKK